MLKTGYKNGFVILMRWGMILLIQFDEKKKEKNGFQREIKRGENGFQRDEEPVFRMHEEEDEQFRRGHESGLPDLDNRLAG